MRRPAQRLVALLVVVLVLAGCGLGGGGTAPRGGQAATTPPDAGAPVQAFNGPPTGDPPIRLTRAPARPLRSPPGVAPRGGLLFDIDTGRVLWDHASTRSLPIASLTKMMTALVVVQHSRPDEKVRISKLAAAAPGSRVGVLPTGKRVRLESLLYGLLLPSGNDAAVALAQHVGGSVPGFVAMMNAESARLGLRDTRFDSPSGFEETRFQQQARNRSTARDLAVLTRAVLDEPRLARIVRSRSVSLRFPIKGGRLSLVNNNPLLLMRYPGTIGVKTGYTDAAGHCLVAAVQRGRRRLGIVLLHSPGTAGQAMPLMNRAFGVPTR